MRNRLLLWFCCLFYLSSSVAGTLTEKDFQLTERKLLTFHLDPAVPKVGQRVNLFLQANTGITKNEIVAEALLDEGTLKLTNTGAELWSGSLKPFSEVKTHQIVVNIFARDATESTRLRSAIRALKREIDELNIRIDAETDADKKIQLEMARDQKQAYSDDLDTSLDGMKRFLKSESFDFVVTGDSSNPDYPVVTGVAPNASPLGKHIRVVITGENLPANPNVKFSGQNATVISAGDSFIEVLAPNFSVVGEKVLEVTFPATEAAPKKNAVFTNGFFVSDRAILKNLRPVAVSNGYQKVTWPVTAPAVLQAVNSYDENGDTFSYEWIFQKSPAGSVFATGTVLENSATPSFTPDKVGIYTIKLRLLETTTEELLNSPVNTVTVEVK